jgi:large subunit ribosomal protein L14e
MAKKDKNQIDNKEEKEVVEETQKDKPLAKPAKEEADLFEIGRLCIKTSGEEKGRECVVVDILGKTFMLIDGNVKRRKCNIMHLRPTSNLLGIKKNASTSEVKEVMRKEGIKIREIIRMKDKFSDKKDKIAKGEIRKGAKSSKPLAKPLKK